MAMPFRKATFACWRVVSAGRITHYTTRAEARKAVKRDGGTYSRCLETHA